jgi:hypothetical protein
MCRGLGHGIDSSAVGLPASLPTGGAAGRCPLRFHRDCGRDFGDFGLGVKTGISGAKMMKKSPLALPVPGRR